MGKDREGRYIPPKGKPSGKEREEDDLGLRQGIEPDDLKQHQEITQKYTSDDKRPAPKVRVMHPNRNVVKAYLNAAEVFVLDKSQMPNGADMAAVMRY